jgi:hypothetical protein
MPSGPQRGEAAQRLVHSRYADIHHQLASARLRLTGLADDEHVRLPEPVHLDNPN